MTDHARLVAALTKAGATITQDSSRSDLWTAVKGNRLVTWYTQEGFPNKERLAATCLRTPSPHTDAMTDCFCDSYHDTIKAAVASVERA